jgi:hypothetical protein
MEGTVDVSSGRKGIEPMTMTEDQFMQEYDNNHAFRDGVRHSAEVMRTFIDYSDVRLNIIDVAWLGHVIASGGQCGCDIDHDYDGGYDEEWCDWYKEHHEEWFCKWHGMTMEEFRAKQEAAAEEHQRKEAELEETRRQDRLEQLHELAKEFGVDPRLLP